MCEREFGYSNTFQSQRNVTRFSNFSGTQADLICQEQPGKNVAVLFGLWGAKCSGGELAMPMQAHVHSQHCRVQSEGMW